MKNLFIITILAVMATACGSGNQEKSEASSSNEITFTTDLENIDSLLNEIPASWKNEKTIAEGMAHSGKFASKIDSTSEFSFVFEQKLSYIDARVPKKVHYTAWIYSDMANTPGSIVVSVNNNAYYKGFKIADFFPAGKEWKQVSATFELPETLTGENIIKGYVWNQNKNPLIIDDISIKFEY